jgi:hypothetical protein
MTNQILEKHIIWHRWLKEKNDKVTKSNQKGKMTMQLVVIPTKLILQNGELLIE